VVAHVAGELGVQRFVLVSTDKAVAPATVMGASKALAEFALEAAGWRFPATRYAAVRFGNVLGSSGSVVPIFRRQIERGGPVTVTDERMTRYFMTIPEAVQLIIRSGSLSLHERAVAPGLGLDPNGGVGRLRPAAALADVYVLEMGEPVPIVELAREMISLSGLDPDSDIEIEIVGRRPGEKLEEELFNTYEHARPTAAEKILLAEREPLGGEQVEAMFAEIGLLVLEGDAAGLAAKVSQLSADLLEAQATGSWPAPRYVRSRHSRVPSGGADGAAHAGKDGPPHRNKDAALPDAPAALIHSPDS
jgi:FlaA1/EpsC-like NDP-sugar epimerase